MLTRETMRHRYSSIPDAEPLGRVMTRLLSPVEGEDQEQQAADLGSKVQDAWLEKAPVPIENLMASGMGELDARVVHGYLERRRVLPGALALRPLRQDPASRDEAFTKLDDSCLRSFDIKPEVYLRLRSEHRRPDDSWVGLAATLLGMRAREVTCAGRLLGPLCRLSPISRTVWMPLLQRCIEKGAVRNVEYGLLGPREATVTNLACLNDLLPRSLPSDFLYYDVGVKTRGSDTENFLRNYLIVCYAEYQREENLRRAEIIVAKVQAMQEARDGAAAGPDIDDAVGLLYARLSECIRAAHSYGNLYSQDDSPQGAERREQIARLEWRETQRDERRKLRDRLEAEAKARFADPGYRAAWVTSHPKLQAFAKLDEATDT